MQVLLRPTSLTVVLLVRENKNEKWRKTEKTGRGRKKIKRKRGEKNTIKSAEYPVPTMIRFT